MLKCWRQFENFPLRFSSTWPLRRILINAPLSAEQISHALEQWLEVEFTFIQVDDLAASIAALPREDQDFLLGWVRRIATTNIQIAHQFALRAISQLAHMDRRMIEAWALHAMDTLTEPDRAPPSR